jgi:hypothetical protein
MPPVTLPLAEFIELLEAELLRFGAPFLLPTLKDL